MVETLSLPDWLTLAEPAQRLILQGGGDALTAATRAWPLGFPPQACRALSDGAHSTLWLGPDEFLLIGPAHLDAFAAIETAIGTIAHSLVDISHRQQALQISGSRCRDILNGGCPLDFDLRAFPVGMCTRTLFVKAEIVLWRTAEEAFQLEVWRSFFDYTCALLLETARIS